MINQKLLKDDRQIDRGLMSRAESLFPFLSAFYTSKYGYKMCLRIYLNGDGTGRGSHLSLFFVVMRGLSDALLKWPFNQKVKDLQTIGDIDKCSHFLKQQQLDCFCLYFY